jgi:hypothetical protein
MPNPVKPEIDYSYSGYQQEQQGVSNFPGTFLDADLAELVRAADETIDALEDIRRSDGALVNAVVTPDSLSPATLALMTAVGATGPSGPTGPAGANGVVQSVVAGSNVSVDSTDPANPIVSSVGGSAATVTFAPAGNIAATNVQAAIEELDAEKQPLDADLTAIAALAPSNDDIMQRKAGAWTNRTLAQLLADLSAVGTTFQPLDSDLTSWAGVTRAAGFDTFAATPSSANLASLVTGETGSGALVFGTSPSFTTDIRPVSNDGASLGISGTAWSDAYLASGGVINGNAGDVTITHSSNRLDFAGAATGYTFDNPVTIGGTTILAGRTFTLDGTTATGGQPAFAFNAPGHTATNRVMGMIYDGASALLKPGLVFQNLDDAGAYVANGATLWRDGSLTLGVGHLVTAGPGCLRLVGGSIQRPIPVTKTANFTVADDENWLINNKSGSACTVTLPSAASYPGREIMFKNIQAQAVNSASSNVVPLAGGAAGTVILNNVAGRWVTLVSDGTNWIAMAGVV